MLLRYIYQYLKFSSKVKFAYTTVIGKNSVFEGMNKIYDHSLFSGYIGLGSYIASDSIVLGKIGRFTSIGPNVRINYMVHPYKAPFATTSPYFFSTNKQNGYTSVNKSYFEEYRYADGINKYPVIIGNDCWIGEGAFLVGGVKIHDGAVILAHAVVTKDVPAYAIYGGIPATLLGYRYDMATINFLLKYQWWRKDIKWLNNNSDLLRDIDKLRVYAKNYINKEGL